MLKGEKRKKFFEDNNHTCYMCLQQFPEKRLQIDHILPKSKYPELNNEFINFAVIHNSCNNYKRSFSGKGLDFMIKYHEERAQQLKRVKEKQQEIIKILNIQK